MPAITLSRLECVQIGPDIFVTVRNAKSGEAILHIKSPENMKLTQFSRNGTGRPFGNIGKQAETIKAGNKILDRSGLGG